MQIRMETKDDFDAVHKMVGDAFLTANVSGGEERALVEQVHGSDKYVPELTLVAEEDGRIVGYIMLSKTTITDGNKKYNSLLLAPVCTVEEKRNGGIGGNLIQAALDAARKMVFGSVFLAGDRNYYSRFGFVPASTFGIRCQHDVPPEMLDNIMGIELTPGALEGVSGIVEL